MVASFSTTLSFLQPPSLTLSTMSRPKQKKQPLPKGLKQILRNQQKQQENYQDELNQLDHQYFTLTEEIKEKHNDQELDTVMKVTEMLPTMANLYQARTFLQQLGNQFNVSYNYTEKSVHLGFENYRVGYWEANKRDHGISPQWESRSYNHWHKSHV